MSQSLLKELFGNRGLVELGVTDAVLAARPGIAFRIRRLKNGRRSV